ncbi:MAG: hypothetical protein J6Y54_04055, partial [Lentisphaeria bacterium]|nr:hypothetical protein [Lentisphaeria bacterium]
GGVDGNGGDRIGPGQPPQSRPSRQHRQSGDGGQSHAGGDPGPGLFFGGGQRDIRGRLLPGGDDWSNTGTFTLFAVMFIFMGILMVGIGVIGEYIGRIYTDVRARPRYFIEEIIGRGDGEEAKK